MRVFGGDNARKKSGVIWEGFCDGLPRLFFRLIGLGSDQFCQ